MLRRSHAMSGSLLEALEMRVVRRAVMLVIVTAFAATGTQSAYAAPPSNDTPGGAALIGALPFSDSVSIDEATTDALDATLNTQCGAPATEGSVWYRFDATQDGGLVFDVSGSTFSAGALVTAGDPANGNFITCGPGAVTFDVVAGQSYFVMAFSDTPGVTTGTLVVRAEATPPPIEVDVTVNPTGTFDPKTGSATISGTLQCTNEEAQFATVDVQLRQAVGRFTILGFGSIEAVCEGTPQPWSVEVLGQTGTFRGGKAVTVAFAFACGPFTCGDDFEERTVRLRRR
jgi:hypothetical protein